jgi:hypothetical protein
MFVDFGGVYKCYCFHTHNLSGAYDKNGIPGLDRQMAVCW